MRYYIDTIEQVKTDEGGVNEYGARTIQPADKTFEEVESAYFTKLAAVANDIGEGDSKKHYYMDIKIVNSDGGIEKKDKIGKRVEVNA